MGIRARLRPAFIAQAAALLVPAATIFLWFQSAPNSALDCGGRDVTQEMARLFRRQLKLTPYARFIDVAEADVRVAAVFDVAAQQHATASGDLPEDVKACVAFATYHAQFNTAGATVEGHGQLQSSLLDELSGEKQVFYSVRRTPEGRRTVRISRISG